MFSRGPGDSEPRLEKRLVILGELVEFRLVGGRSHKLGLLLASNCKQIQAKLMILKLNLAGLEPRPDQNWPQVALIIVHFVVVHFYFGTPTQAKGGQF